MSKDSEQEFHSPVWDRGEAIDAEMMRFTIGDDWLMDQRLVEVDLQGSMAHVDGLLSAELIKPEDHTALLGGLQSLLESWQKGEWNVEAGDEDVHSAIERRLTELIGEAGERLHTGRSRNDQVAVDMRLWVRGAIESAQVAVGELCAAGMELVDKYGKHEIPGYTHLRRGMPSSISDWMGAHLCAFETSLIEFAAAEERIATCPLGSGAGYGIPLKLDRKLVAERLGFREPETPVTATQLFRGRAELAYLNALESLALDLEKLAFDLWLYSTEEFGFVKLPVDLTTGSSLMPHKRNPDLIELIRGHCRQVGSDRDALRAVIAGLPSGYHRDFQLIKPPLFRAHDRTLSCLTIMARLLRGMDFNIEALEKAAADPSLQVTRRALEQARDGRSFRDAYREESRG
jgi:argininosuccinate lyase